MFDKPTLELQALLLSITVLVTPIARGGGMPQAPWPRTVESCEGYRQQAHAYSRAAYQGYFDCTARSRGPIRLSSGQWCDANKRQVIQSTTVFPECSTHAVPICNAGKAIDDAYECLKIAKRQEDLINKERRQVVEENQRRLRDAHAQIAKGAGMMGEAMRLASDWKAHARHVIAPRLTKKGADELVALSFRTDTRSINRQETIADVLFSDGQGFVLERGISDPLIREIADTSLGYSRIVLNEVSNTMLDLGNQIADIGAQPLTSYNSAVGRSSFGAQPNRPMQSLPTGQGAGNLHPNECAILKTPAATDMAIDDPARFNVLRKRCQPR